MKARIDSLRKSRKGGFTLVELIVVLIILAILAALLIPALTGYIDRARTKKIMAQTRQAVMAAQTIYDEKYVRGEFAKVATEAEIANSSSTGIDYAEIITLGDLAGQGNINVFKVTSGTISYLQWQQKKDGDAAGTATGSICTYVNDLTNPPRFFDGTDVSATGTVIN